MGKDIVEHVLLEFAMLVAFVTAGGTPLRSIRRF
jgi:hypothetical protein